MKILKSIFVILLLVGCSKLNEVQSDLKDLDSTPIESQATQDLEKFVRENKGAVERLTPEEWEKLRWLSKAFVLLRGGQGLSSSDDINLYLTKTREMIADELVRAPEFFGTVLKYNYYFLGMNLEEVYTEDGTGFNAGIGGTAPAFNSAAAFQKGGDYFSFFDADPLVPFLESREPYYYDEATQNSLAGQEALDAIRKERLDRIESLKKIVAPMSDPIDMATYCSQYSFGSTLFGLGLPLPNFNILFSLDSKPFLGCNFSDPQNPTVILSKKEVEDRLAVYEKIMINLLDYAESRYGVNVGTDLSKVDFIRLNQLFPGEKSNFFSGTLSFTLTNSSTNFNRKRAAYMLDRFLCDDLVPIDVELPDQHQGGAHGTEPSCYACHYRLDPMAGFFKNFGTNFTEFTGVEEIIFDDLARMKLKDYEKNWLSPPNSPRKWNIGVVRSEKDDSKNQYGENLQDMLTILSKMPEVKHCMVKRAFEFSTSKGQNVDQGFLHNIGEEFIKLSKTDSSEAIRYVFKTFALSNTFSKIDPVADQCYDFPAGHNPDGAPPCQVNFILQQKCSKCHYPFGGEKGLDLTTWKKMEGDRYGFVHEPSGSQLSLSESFKRIANSLQSTDPKKRMPYKQHMDPTDRETLFLWVNQQMRSQQ